MILAVLGSSSTASFQVLLQCQGYYGSLDRAHDVLTYICDDHVIWWPKEGWTEWIRNLCTVVMTHNDLCTCIALTKWDGPIVCVNVTENVENFQSKFYHFTAIQTSVTVSVEQLEHDRVTRCTFWFQRSKDDITIVAQHVRDLFTTATEWPSQRRDWNASAIWNREFLKTNLEIFFPISIAYQTGTYEMTHKSA